MIATLAAAAVAALPPVDRTESPCGGAAPVVLCDPQEREHAAEFLNQLRAMMEALQLTAREIRDVSDQIIANIVRNI